MNTVDAMAGTGGSRAARPDMTTGRAALVLLLHRYTERALEVSLIEVQKLLYFLQVAGESLRLRFQRGYALTRTTHGMC